MKLNIFNKKQSVTKTIGENTANKPKINKLELNTEQFASGVANIQDILSPSSIYIDFNHVKIGNRYFKSIFVSGYPRYVGANWLNPVITFDHPLNISMFYYPVEAKGVLDDLKRKITEFQAQLSSDKQKGKIVDPTILAALEDAKSLQEKLVKGVERFFQFSFYITIPADSLEELEDNAKRLQGVLGSLMIAGKNATLQMEQTFQTTIPMGLDKLAYVRNMDTSAVATTFPFTSSDLTMASGIMYGINKHNGSLIIFDRFSPQLENSNSCVFATSGAGKSYLVKLEILRSLMFGTECIAIDPEREYKNLSEAVGGQFIEFAQNSNSKINPFDLPTIPTDYKDNEIAENVLGTKILSLHSFFKIIFKNLTNQEEAVLDKSIIETYRMKGITEDKETHSKEVPVMEDLYKVLMGMDEEEAKSLAVRMERYVKGSLSGIFNSRTTVNLNNPFTVFSVRNLEDVLRPIAYYMILDFIWTKVRTELKKRLLVVDEAWYLMTHPDSAYFMYSISKRARKYYLGLTTISQDVSDFLNSEYGQVIITNASIKILLKQSPSAIDKLGEVFHLSEGEKRLLLSVGIGEGLFFAGSNHVAIKIIASREEDRIITTNPEQLIKQKIEEAQKQIQDKEKNTIGVKTQQANDLNETPTKRSIAID